MKQVLIFYIGARHSKTGLVEVQVPFDVVEERSMVAEEPNYSLLTPIFCTPKDLEEELEWKKLFKQSFNISPGHFRKFEANLEKKCTDYSNAYVKPRLDDSVEETLTRKATI